METGSTLLIPAMMGQYNLVPGAGGATLLQVHIRKMEEDSDNYLEK